MSRAGRRIIMGCIYKITCIINNRVYIGQTISKPNKRWSDHKRNPNKKMKPDIEKYGWVNFDKIILFDNIPEEELNDLEIDVISTLKPYYNTTKGGDGGSGLYGEDNPSALLTNSEITNFRRLFSENKITIEKIISETNLGRGSITSFLNGTTYSSADGPIVDKLPNSKSENNPFSKLKNKQVEEYRIKYKNSKISVSKIMQEAGISAASVYSFLRGKTYKEASGPLVKQQKRKTIVEVRDIRNLHKSGVEVKELESIFGGCPQTIYNIINGSTFKTVGGPIKGVDY